MAMAAATWASPEELTPQTRRPPIEEVDNQELAENDFQVYLAAAVDGEGLVGHNIRSYNHLADDGFSQILTDLFQVENTVVDLRDSTPEDRDRHAIKIAFSFHDVEMGTPTYSVFPLGKTKSLYPNEARINRRTYAAQLFMGAELVLTAYYKNRVEEVKRVTIPRFAAAPIPVMVGSNRCHTWNLTREARKGLQEDPNESGGYFLAKGGEWVVDWLENIAFNALHVFRRMAPKERARSDFISQPGGVFENSSQVIIRLMASGALTIEINSTKFSKSKIPFYILYRILGMTSDAEILETIVYDPESTAPVTRHMVQVVDRALAHEDPTYASLRYEIDREKLTKAMAVRLSRFVTNTTNFRSNEHAQQYLNENLLTILDRVFFPHMGRDDQSRHRKLRFLGMCIHKTLLVDGEILPPTDRDSLVNKRMHGAGTSIAKAFKTQFNSSVIQPVFRALKRLVRTEPFEQLTSAAITGAFTQPINTSDLARTMEQALTSGNKTIVIRRRCVANRVSTQALERKNTTNYISALRTVSAHSGGSPVSKQTERADMMRRVHPTYPGFICVAKSAEGEMVGMKKELAISATLVEAGDALPLLRRLEVDPQVIPLDRVEARDIERKALAMVFVDGYWVGCTTDAPGLVTRYRELRREGRVVDPRASIVWHPITDDVEFLLDVGRMARPLLIVDNNLAAYDEGCRRAWEAAKRGESDPDRHRVQFVQNTRFVPAHAAGLKAGTLSLEDLRAEGVLEWITPNEAANCLLAPSIRVLRAARHDVVQRYTHLDVEAAIFGITAHLSPFGNHTQPARVTYETNQARQAAGWYCSAFPFRVDKNRFFQHYVEAPLVRTIAYNWLVPNGLNAVVAYMVSGGYNQEDSAILSSAFIQRGAFAGAYFKTELAELEKGEKFGNPDMTATKNLKPNASYAKLVDGFVTVGAQVSKGDVLIGRFAAIQTGGRRKERNAEARSDGYEFLDRSIVYHSNEPATVVDVAHPRGPNDTEFGLVRLRYHRPLDVGGKLSSRSGNKSITALLLPPADMPYTEDGVTPDLIINPHSIPSRMVIGQMIETSLGQVCQEQGVVTDGTSFRPISVEDVAAELAAVGLRHNGRTRLFNGATGEHYDAAIFVGPTFHQRLQKFVEDDEYSVGAIGPTDALTGQPLEGRSARGGLRLGEMEAWVLHSHGASMATMEKMFRDSDGRKCALCRNCGLAAIYNPEQGYYRCNTCKERADIVGVDGCKASQAFQHEVRTANVVMEITPRPREFLAPAPPLS